MTACALLFQFGACAFNSKPQKVPVTSDPVGARIIADGREAGTTPLTLSLDRSTDHTIRIERPGYNPVEIMLVSKAQAGKRAAGSGASFIFIPIFALLGAAAGAVLDSSILYDDTETASNTVVGFALGALVGTGLMVAFAGKSDKAYLTPSLINVTLEKTPTSAQARTKVVILDRDQLKDIRWIRISCAEGGEAGVVAVN